MWWWGAWFGSYLAKRICEVGKSALFEVRLIPGPQNPALVVLGYANSTIWLQTRRPTQQKVIYADPRCTSRVKEGQSSSTSLARKEMAMDSGIEMGEIAASLVGNRVLGYGSSIEKVQSNTKRNVHRTIHPQLHRPRVLRAHTQEPLHCPPNKWHRRDPLLANLLSLHKEILMKDSPYNSRFTILNAIEYSLATRSMQATTH